VTGHLPKIASPNLPNALCADNRIDPEIFFADDCQQPDKSVVEQARAICIQCPDRVPCLMWGLQHENFGMWGGFTANERRDFKKRKLNKLKHLKEFDLL
jgi:WhiB family redox-sensing transcriptional regulator